MLAIEKQATENNLKPDACNCRGVWGKGAALEFKKRFPAAFNVYKIHCTSPASDSHQRSLLGTALLIPPQELTTEEETGAYNTTQEIWIACVFTSVGYGKKVSKPNTILESTKTAMIDLEKQLKTAKEAEKAIGELWAVKINSGSFHVPWEETKKILEQCGLDIKVFYPSESSCSVSGDRTQDSRFSFAAASEDARQITHKLKRKNEQLDGSSDERKTIGARRKRQLQD
ncbi:MAG: ADP-ribose 1''-phosphate phosphatase [Icmadophila ericetorum]|nr:ADP-ribose 1''-phosphate phosphatase [Icmadophila ericetorum]